MILCKEFHKLNTPMDITRLTRWWYMDASMEPKCCKSFGFSNVRQLRNDWVRGFWSLRPSVRNTWHGQRSPISNYTISYEGIGHQSQKTTKRRNSQDIKLLFGNDDGNEHYLCSCFLKISFLYCSLFFLWCLDKVEQTNHLVQAV